MTLLSHVDSDLMSRVGISLSHATLQYLSNAFSPDLFSNAGSNILEFMANILSNLAKTACQIQR